MKTNEFFVNNTIYSQTLTALTFAPYGDVIDIQSQPYEIINQGRCQRYTDLATLDFTENGSAAISLFQGKKCALPYTLEYVERHPLGSQAFVPMPQDPFLIIVARNDNNQPVAPQAFISKPGQGVNYHRGVWHGVLTPLHEPAPFAVIDRVGAGQNLQEYWFDEPYTLRLPLN